MRRRLILLLVLAALVAAVAAAAPAAAKPSSCVTIQSGTLLSSTGAVITTGYDQWGYNYQALCSTGSTTTSAALGCPSRRAIGSQ